MRLVSYNIQYCVGLLGKRRDYLKFWRLMHEKKGVRHKIVEFLEQYHPDLVALVEVDFGSARTHHIDQAASIAHSLGLHHSLHKIKYQKKLIGRIYTHLPILSHQGTALLSRYELEGEMHWLNRGVKRLVLEATIHCPEKITIFVVHLALTKKVRAIQLDQLAELILQKQNPVLVVGDFNTLRSIDELAPFLKKTQMYIPKSIKPSYPAYRPKKTLDYALATNDILITNAQLVPFYGSDHLPLIVDFRLRKKKEHEHNQ